ncbi:AraC family transcriptional regulator ligand-binding domain-containing protein [Gordonia sp. VNK21]|uniref:AraC family transcriptional regulator n=1 Tax=Gordonia sp. VNK21 TaxID=3382483 RepID=UPI0038D4B421
MSYTIPMQFFRATIDALSRRDIDVAHAVGEAGLDWQLFSAERARMTPEQATAVTVSLWKQTGDELLGMGPRRLPRGSLRLAALSVIHTPDLRAALTRIGEFTEVTMGTKISLVVDGDLATLSVGSAAEPVDPIVAFSAVAGVHRFSAWLIDAPVAVRSLQFPFDASHLSSDYETIFGAPATFTADRLSLGFDAALLDRPAIRTEADLKALLRNAPGSLFYPPSQSTTLESRIRRILDTDPNGPWIASNELAGRVFMSAPHMRRRLRSEGTSVRDIQDGILRDRAVRALVHSDEPIADIAARLGYSEPSAFRRAFHRWTGSAPIDYRQGPKTP